MNSYAFPKRSLMNSSSFPMPFLCLSLCFLCFPIEIPFTMGAELARDLVANSAASAGHEGDLAAENVAAEGRRRRARRRHS